MTFNYIAPLQIDAEVSIGNRNLKKKRFSVSLLTNILIRWLDIYPEY